MPRRACIDIPAFPLQLLLREQPSWVDEPVAVVDVDKPKGLVLWVNEVALRAGVLPGHRYGDALSLVPGLRASPVAAAAIAAGAAAVVACLQDFTPDVEPSPLEPGVYWLDASGMEGLFETSEAWARQVRHALAGLGYIAAVVVGFRRFATYAVARALHGRRIMVFDDPAREEATAMRVPLALAGLPTGVRDALSKLGIKRVGDFVRLPGHGIRQRFGPEAHRLHRFAAGDLDVPVQPTPVVKALAVHRELDYREDSTERLIFTLKPLVDELLETLRQRGEALVELQFELVLEGLPAKREALRPAEPTLASVTVMELVKLRLEAAPLPGPVIALQVEATGQAATRAQLGMWEEPTGRDMAAGVRAIARLRAAYGEDAVVRATAHDRHLPEGHFAWEPLAALPPPRPAIDPTGTLVRRLLARPLPLPDMPMRGPDGWLLMGLEPGPVSRLLGPYRLTGGWWRAPGGTAEVQRDYYFVALRRGDLFWVYYDGQHRRWYLHGEIS